MQMLALNLTTLAAHAAQAPELTPVIELVDATVRLASLILPIIGVTGGLKGLLGRLPDVNLGLWRVPPGIYISWTVALPLTALAYVNGWLPALESFETLQGAIGAYWVFLAATANVVRNAIVGRELEAAKTWAALS